MRKVIYGAGLYQVGGQFYRFWKSYDNLTADDAANQLDALFQRKKMTTTAFLQGQYGKGEWALVTGASEGIGREYAH